MITLKEYLGNTDLNFVPVEHQKNIDILLPRLHLFESAYGRLMVKTSGYRSRDDQISVYKAKGITDIAKIPMNSWHLKGGACDFSDPDGSLWLFCLANLSLCKSIGLWLEDPRWTHGASENWMHFQICPPGSGKRIFIPNNMPAISPAIWNGVYAKQYD